MWKTFKSWPTSVKFALSFLLGLIVAGIALFPAIAVPLILILLTVVSLLRVMIYFVHNDRP